MQQSLDAKKRRRSPREKETTASRKARCQVNVRRQETPRTDCSSVEDEICVSAETSTPSHSSPIPSQTPRASKDSHQHSTDGVELPEHNSAVNEHTTSTLLEAQVEGKPMEGNDGDNAHLDPKPEDEHPSLAPDVPVDVSLSSDAKATSTPSFEDSDLLQPLIEACKESDTGPPGSPPAEAAVESLQLGGPASISYHYFPWIAAYNISSCLPNDVIQMHSEGCFDLPTHKILDQFVEQYFLHVHPLLPLLNEADFWNLYSSRQTADWEPISLLVVQAMIFASSNFVSRECIKSLGFENTRSARATFYRRAKLLYDFGTEPSHIAISQSALLLSSWTPPSNMQTKENTLWLTIAIENAKDAGADGYSQYAPQLLTTAQMKHCNILKRLWWCCIIRDRVMPLGLRRSIQITYAHFDFGGAERLSLWDLEDEIDHSRVYDADSKKELIEIVIQLCELCVVLTDILLLVFPQHAWIGLRRDPGMEDARIRDSKATLQSWNNAAQIRLAGPVGGKSQHYSSIMYKNLVFIYYHSAWVSLCHHELTCLVAAPETVSINNEKFAKIRATSKEIQSATSSMDHSLETLNQLELTRWLPINAVAYAAYPLALNALDIYLSTTSSSALDAISKCKTSEGAKIFIEAIRTLHPQYDGVDWMANIVRSAVHVVQENPNSPKEAFTKWTDLLVFQPRRYLQLSIVMDLGFRNGKIPGREDIPAHFKDMVNIELKWSIIQINHPIAFRKANMNTKKRPRKHRKQLTGAEAAAPTPATPIVGTVTVDENAPVTPYQSIHTSTGLDAVIATTGLTTMDPFEDLPLGPHPGLSNFQNPQEVLHQVQEIPAVVANIIESEFSMNPRVEHDVKETTSESLVTVPGTGEANMMENFNPGDFLFDEVWESYRDSGCGVPEWVAKFLADKNPTPVREMTSVGAQEKFSDPWWYFTTA